MRTFLLSLVLAGCTGSVQSAAPTVAGEVTAVDVSPWAYDGNATIDVRTKPGETVRVEVPARTNLCQAELGAVDEIRAGDRVEVRGEQTADGRVTPCTEPAHYLRVVARAEPGLQTYRGVFESGFETAAFHPCDRPDERWWTVPDESFNAQFDALRQPARARV